MLRNSYLGSRGEVKQKGVSSCTLCSIPVVPVNDLFALARGSFEDFYRVMLQIRNDTIIEHVVCCSLCNSNLCKDKALQRLLSSNC